MSNFKEELGKVKAFVFDVDGVLSNARIFLHPEHHLMRTMNIKDGYALQYAIRKDYPIGIITGGNSRAVETRFRNLGISDIYLSSRNKQKDLKDFLSKHDMKPENILYMGDDIPDYHAMKYCGIAACPSDAATEIKAASDYISPVKGGEGCARDVIEQVMKVQGLWINDDAFTW